jgi:hypothetical protein
VAQGKGLEFKPQYAKPQKKKKANKGDVRMKGLMIAVKRNPCRRWRKRRDSNHSHRTAFCFRFTGSSYEFCKRYWLLL